MSPLRRPLPPAVPLLALALLAGACNPLDRKNPFDQKRCDPPCGDGFFCLDGECQLNPCPAGMIFASHPIGWDQDPPTGTPFCIDAWEAPAEDPTKLRAGVLPLVGLSRGAAFAVCRDAGKLLCSPDQWMSACLGPNGEQTDGFDDKAEHFFGPRREHCNLGDGAGLNKTGDQERCEGGYTGIFDLVGNASEWVMACKQGVCPSESQGSDEVALAGGAYAWEADTGPDNHSCGIMPLHRLGDLPADTVGFRCCLPCQDALSCPASQRTWFPYRVHSNEPPDSLDTMGFAPTSLWGTSPGDIWAVGDKDGELGIAHFDGTVWRLSYSGGFNGPGTSRPAIWGTAAGDLWVTDGVQVLRYDGTGNDGRDVWQTEQVFDRPDGARLNGGWAASREDAWIVGSDGSQARIWRLFAHGWSRVSGVDTGMGEDLRAIWGSSADDVWAVGDSYTLLHYDGSAWIGHQPPDLGQASSVWGSSSGDVWVVGSTYSRGDSQGAIFHFDGASWSLEHSDENVMKLDFVGGSEDDIWAVADADPLVVYHRVGDQWQTALESDQLGTNSAEPLPLWVASPSDLWLGLTRYY